MNKDDLRKFVEENPKLVSMKSAGKNIFVLKYRKKVFYDNLWNDYLAECRGSIVDADFNLVSYPFTKIYNYGIEKEAPVLAADTKVTAFRKVNGFMAAMTWHNGKLLVSTTGSTDSPYVAMVEELMGENRYKFEDHCEFYKDFTWMFEAVHSNDPHIIPEKEGLYLLGWRKKEWDSRVECDPFALGSHAQVLCTHHVESVTTSMSRLQQLAKECRHEGYVFYTDEGVSAKIKSPYYLVNKALARKKDIFSLNKELVEEEYFPLVEHLLTIRDEFNSMNEQTRLDYTRSFLSK